MNDSNSVFLSSNLYILDPFYWWNSLLNFSYEYLVTAISTLYTQVHTCTHTQNKILKKHTEYIWLCSYNILAPFRDIPWTLIVCSTCIIKHTFLDVFLPASSHGLIILSWIFAVISRFTLKSNNSEVGSTNKNEHVFFLFLHLCNLTLYKIFYIYTFSCF